MEITWHLAYVFVKQLQVIILIHLICLEILHWTLRRKKILEWYCKCKIMRLRFIFYSFLSRSVWLLVNYLFFLKKHLNTPKLSCILYARDINVFLGPCVLDSHDFYTTEILDTLNVGEDEWNVFLPVGIWLETA